jgi:uncharacterized repeat protein (TIGR01451 family)
MNNTKIGTFFIVSILALAGIGITYAGLTQNLNIFGTISTGTVDIEIDDYSGTYVWKVYDAADEIVITDDPTFTVPSSDGFRVAYAEGREILPEDVTLPEEKNYDAMIVFDNLFPCIDFTADILFHYVGTIPGKITDINYYWEGSQIDTDGDGTPDTNFIDYLQQLAIDTDYKYGMWGNIFRCDEEGVPLEPLQEITVGTQLHECNYFKLEVTVHLPQDNMFQDLTGWGYVDLSVLQWNDQCVEKPDIEINKYVKDNDAWVEYTSVEVGQDVDFRIVVENTGEIQLTNVYVEDDLPNYLVYNYDATPAEATATDHHIEWDLGTLDVAQSVEILFSANADSEGTGGYNYAEVTTEQGVSDDDTAYVDVVDTGIPDIEITKTADTSGAPTVVFTITAHNIGTAEATGVVVEDILPSGFTYSSHSTSQGDYLQNAGPGSDEWGTWNVGTLTAGQAETLTITGSVPTTTGSSQFTQLALILDGSGSIGSTDFGIMKEGLATAVEDDMPHDGSAELLVIHFAGEYANVEYGPEVVTTANYQSIANIIRAIPYRGAPGPTTPGAATPLACGLYLAADELYNSDNFSTSVRQVLNIVTDGRPNIVADYPDNPYEGDGEPVDYEDGEASAITAMAYLKSTLSLTSDQDEIDVEAIGDQVDAEWLKTNMVWPLPAYEDWPPSGPGWIQEIETYQDFAGMIGEKFELIFIPIENCAELISSTPADTNSANNIDCVTVDLGGD